MSKEGGGGGEKEKQEGVIFARSDKTFPD